MVNQGLESGTLEMMKSCRSFHFVFNEMILENIFRDLLRDRADREPTVDIPDEEVMLIGIA
jgi:hypothetical protein